jgi:uncharacterized protein YcbX
LTSVFILTSHALRRHSLSNTLLPQLIYHDDGPFLMTTESSMSDLTRRLADSNADPPVTMDYFRPSITVQGQSLPFDEVIYSNVERWFIEISLSTIYV